MPDGAQGRAGGGRPFWQAPQIPCGAGAATTSPPTKLQRQTETPQPGSYPQIKPPRQRVPEDRSIELESSLLASNPASILNQTRTPLGIPRRFRNRVKCSSAAGSQM